MPRRHIISIFLGILALVVGMSEVVAASNDRQAIANLRTELRAFADKAEDDAFRYTSASSLIQQSDLGRYVGLGDFRVPSMGEEIGRNSALSAEFQMLDLRLALARLSQSYRSQDHLDIMLAQDEEDLTALVIRSGEVTLRDIRRMLKRDYEGVDEFAGGPLVLYRPVIIWDDAKLVVSPGEDIQFSRKDGAFLVNFGRLEITGSHITTTPEQHPESPDFVPFIATAGGGNVLLTDSIIEGLGFGRTPKFSGFSVVRNPLVGRNQGNILLNNVFVDLVSIAISNSSDSVIRGNRFHDMRAEGIALVRAPNTRILGNLFTGNAPTNSVRIYNNSSGSRVSGNILLRGEYAGIVVQNNSDDVLVSNNIIWRRIGGGIRMGKVACGSVVDNLVMDNRQKGIEIRSAEDIDVSRNLIVENHNAGIWVSAQLADTTTYIRENVLVKNGAGISSATGAMLALNGNDFSEQFPRFFDGDLSFQSNHIVQDIYGRTPIVLTAAGPALGQGAGGPNCSQ
jgi:poly(beta-D-mannuronate) C5 epimerase